MKHITFVKFTDEGRRHLPESKEVLRKVYDVIEGFDGKIEGMWATLGPYDFVVIADYHSGEKALKARTKLLEMKYFILESYEAFDVQTFLATV